MPPQCFSISLHIIFLEILDFNKQREQCIGTGPIKSQVPIHIVSKILICLFFNWNEDFLISI